MQGGWDTQVAANRARLVALGLTDPPPGTRAIDIGAGTGYQNPGAGFANLGPAFGNWSPGRGFLGMTIRDPNGASSSDIFYAFADITLNPDYSITLNAFAYESELGQSITTSFTSPVPEPASGLLLGSGLAAGLWWMRRRERRG